MAWGRWGSYGYHSGHKGGHSHDAGHGAKASGAKSYHNGGVEGDRFSNWYDKYLAKHYKDDEADGTGGSKGSGTGGSKGSGTGGSKGSGSGGSKGTGGTSGTGCDHGGGSGGGDGKPSVSFTMGTDPQVDVTVTQDVNGQLFFNLTPTSFAGDLADIDGLFFNMTDDSDLNGLHFYPDENTLPVTGHEANANAVN